MSAYGITLKEEVFDSIKEVCYAAFDEGETELSSLAMKMMDVEGVPVNYPYHHFIVPAAYLVAACKETGRSKDDLKEMLDEAHSRSLNVLGGFCGNYGACGAGIGAGIFMSVFTECSPMAVEPWQWANEVTGIALQGISKYAGPRCCKRGTFLSFISAVPYINETLGLNLKINGDVLCKYHDLNNECKKTSCPFFPKEA